jgi:hypothetical protein
MANTRKYGFCKPVKKCVAPYWGKRKEVRSEPKIKKTAGRN